MEYSEFFCGHRQPCWVVNINFFSVFFWVLKSIPCTNLRDCFILGFWERNKNRKLGIIYFGLLMSHAYGLVCGAFSTPELSLLGIRYLSGYDRRWSTRYVLNYTGKNGLLDHTRLLRNTLSWTLHHFVWIYYTQTLLYLWEKNFEHFLYWRNFFKMFPFYILDFYDSLQYL